MDISSWDFFNLASSSTTWVRLRGVLLQLWHSQFFAFLNNELGRLLEISLTIDTKLDLAEVWLKIVISDTILVPHEMDVDSQMGKSVIKILTFSCDDVPFLAIAGKDNVKALERCQSFKNRVFIHDDA